MTNRVQNYIENLNHTISRTTNPTDIQILGDIQGFLGELGELFGRPSIISGPVDLAFGQGLPVGRVTEMVSPVPAPAAPGAVMLSSGVAPQVDGCIAAQPNTIMQQAAQQRLNQLLAEETAKKAAVQEQLNQGIAQAQAQDALTQNFMSQIQQAPAPAVAPAQPVAQASAPQQEMTLAQFVASQQTAPSAPAPAPSGEMTLADFVKSQQAKPVVNLQEQLNAELAAQQTLSQPAPGVSSPLA